MIRYQHLEGGVVSIRLDSPPLNAISLNDLKELHEAVRRADEDPEVRGVVLIGREDHFSAGADIHLFRKVRTAEDAVRLSAQFQAVFQEVENLSKPVVAALAGRVMGGALELALACHVRVCTDDTTFSMPEVTLGIVPGAGGTQRLPRLIGPGPALEMMLTGKPVPARKAHEMGLVDLVCPADRLVSQASELLASGLEDVRRTGELTEKVEDRQVLESAFAAAQKLAEQARPELLAPRLILDAVRVGLTESLEAGLKAERDAIAQCATSTATQNKLYLFFATRSTAKVPWLSDVESAPVETVAVVGMGTMGTGIAQAFAQSGFRVLVRDQDPSVVEKGIQRIGRSIQKRREQGRLSEEQATQILGKISAVDDMAELADVGLVVEAVFEDAAIKRDVLQQLEAVCQPETVLASNTSTISLDELAGSLQRPERLVGLHFFNPAHRMPLVEVIHREGTAARVLATALALAKRLRKTPVLVKNREGFLVNRVFIPYLKEAFWLLEEGAEPRAIDQAAVDFGFPMGPLALIDMAGLDILEATDRVLRRAFPWHGPESVLVERLVEAGHLGQKTGAGVYKYQPGDYTPQDHAATGDLLQDIRQQGNRAARPIDSDEITDRLVLRMVAEAFRVLEDAIIQRESDMDVAMVLGVGFPDFRGGVVRYARDRGLDHVVQRLEALAERHGERFAPNGLLRRLSGAGSRRD